MYTPTEFERNYLLFIYVTLLVSLLVVGSLLAIGLSAYIVKHFGATYMYIHIS